MPGWPCRRLIIEGLATWTEVTTTMSIGDVMDMIDSADAHYDAVNAPQTAPPRTRR